MWPNPQETVDLVTFTVEILNGKLHFLRSGLFSYETVNVGKLPWLFVCLFCFASSTEMGG